MGRGKVARWALACAVASGLSACVSFAQGTLEGVMTTPEGTPLPGMCCIYLNKPGLDKPIGPTSTRPDGSYRFSNLEPGVYTIEVRVTGFNRMDVPNIRVLASDRSKYDIRLMAETGEVVEVIGKQKVVQVTTQQKQTFSPEMVSDLPSIGNTFQAIIKNAAGVTITDDGEIVIRGARATETQVRLSNVNMSDPFGIFGTNPIDISTEAIEEIQVTTGGFDASQFGFQGGQVRIIPKQGTNEREGSFGLNYRSSLFDGNAAWGWVRPSDAEFAIYEPSMTLGGPFIRDTFWYFTNIVYNQRKYPSLKQKAKTGEYVPYDWEISGFRTILLRTTYQFNDKNKISLLYAGNRLEERNLANTYFLTGTYIPPDSDVTDRDQQHTFELKVDSVLGAKMNLESTFGVIGVHSGRAQTRPFHEKQLIPCSRYPGFGLNETHAESDEFVICDGDEALGPFPLSYTFRRQSLQWEEKVTMFVDKRFGGDHRLLFGFRVSRDEQEYRFSRLPVFTFLDRTRPDDDQQVDASFSYNQPRDDSIFVTGIYFQDDLTISRRWDVGFGFNFVDQRYTTFGYQGKDTYDDLCQSNPANCPIISALMDANGRVALEANRGCLDVDHLLSTDSDVYWNTVGLWKCWFVNPENYTDIGINDVRFLVPGILNYLTTPEALKFGVANLTVSTSVIWKPFGDDDTIVTAFLSRYYGMMGNATGWETTAKVLNHRFSETDGTGGACVDYMTYKSQAKCYGTTDYYMLDRDLDTPYTNEWSITVQRNLTSILGTKLVYTSRRSYKQLFPINVNTTYDADGEVAGLKNKNFRRIYYLSNFETRRYESFEFHLDKQLSRGWEIKSNYTYSKASGIAEDIGNFRSNDPRFALLPEAGYLDDDQRHFIKISLLNYLPGQFRVGTIINWESGLPYSVVYRATNPECIPDGIGNVETYCGLGRNAFRNPSHWRIDMALHKDFTFEKGSGSVSLEVSNILNQAFIGDQEAIILASSGGLGRLGVGGAGGGAGTVETGAGFFPYFDFGRRWEFSFKYRF